jgi:hypothetical protein
MDAGGSDIACKFLLTKLKESCHLDADEIEGFSRQVCFESQLLM